MRWSEFVHAFPDQKILWHALRFDKYMVGEQDILDRFSPGAHIETSDFSEVILTELFARGFIVKVGVEEPCLLDYAHIVKERRTIQALYLILTTKCNLRCDYCLYKADKSGSLTGIGQHMSKEVAYKAINLFVQEASKNDRSNPEYWEEVTLYGGEPLLNRSCLESAIEYIRKLQSEGKAWHDIHFVLNTNGTLLDASFMEFVRREQIEVQVSIDGPEDIHNRVRQFPTGRGSFERVVHALEQMQSAGLDFVPLLTVTDANMDSLASCVEWLCQTFSIKRYGLNLLMHTYGSVDPNYGMRAEKAVKEAHAVAASYGAADRMYEGVFQVFEEKRIASQSCGAGRKLVVFPGGGIHACQALEASGITEIGHLPVFLPDDPNRILWGRRNRFNNAECLSCPAIGGCGGGCGASAYNASGNAQGVDPNHCAFIKHTFAEWLGK